MTRVDTPLQNVLQCLSEILNSRFLSRKWFRFANSFVWYAIISGASRMSLVIVRYNLIGLWFELSRNGSIEQGSGMSIKSWNVILKLQIPKTLLFPKHFAVDRFYFDCFNCLIVWILTKNIFNQVFRVSLCHSKY